jgi:hypothetical protein
LVSGGNRKENRVFTRAFIFALGIVLAIPLLNVAVQAFGAAGALPMRDATDQVGQLRWGASDVIYICADKRQVSNQFDCDDTPQVPQVPQVQQPQASVNQPVAQVPAGQTTTFITRGAPLPAGSCVDFDPLQQSEMDKLGEGQVIEGNYTPIGDWTWSSRHGSVRMTTNGTYNGRYQATFYPSC